MHVFEVLARDNRAGLNRKSNLCTMGLVTAAMIISNPRLPDLQPVEVEALADTGSLFLTVPESVATQLQLETLELRTVKLADGSSRQVPYAGPVQLFFKNRHGFTGALVMGDQVLFGAIPMEDMDLIVNPRTQVLEIPPEAPNIPRGQA